jgi:hypothetical protein
MTDNLAMISRIYRFADQPESERARTAMKRYLETHPPGRYGTVAYRLEDLGLDAAERRHALCFYQQRFGIEDE